MKIASIIIIASSLCFFTQLTAQSVYNITSFGAVPNKEELSTTAIQKAIDKCAENGGGQVLIPAGTFIAGSIFLKSGVSLFLDAAAVLKGSPNYSDYYWPNKNSTLNKALVCAVNQQNISICGRGIIDGNGGHSNYYSPDPRNGKENRPNVICMLNSSHVKLKEFTVKDGGRWDVTVDDCDFVSVDDIKVLSRIVANNDGLDLTDCHNVTVSNSYFDCGDDGICLKSVKKRGVKNITITNCTIKSESNGIKFGTSSVGGFEDIAITNCIIYDTRLSGLALELVDGGAINRVVINNITMHRVNGSIFLKLGKRKGDTPGSFKNVFISNIIADGIGQWKADTTAPYFKASLDTTIGVVIAGQPGYDLENIQLNHIYLQFAGGGKKEDASRTLRDNPATYPEYTNFGVTPAYGVNCRNINNLSLNNITLDYAATDARPAIYLENVRNADLSAIKAKLDPSAKSYINAKNVQSLFIHTCKPSSANIPFLSLSGEISDISLINNDLKALTTIYTAPENTTKEISISANNKNP